MMKKLSKATILLSLLLVGCATTYQEEGFFSNGFTDSKIADDTFIITFRANEFTSEEDVLAFALHRSADVTLHSGYRYFVIHDEKSYLHKPSVRFTIQCYKELPSNPKAVDALALNQ
jgi:hypothetical protein